MPDDTAATLGGILGCEPWDVVAVVERMASATWGWAALVADRDVTITTLQVELADARSPQHQRRVRLEQARQLAPKPGPYRDAILAALRRGKEWGDITEADYLRLTAKLCHWCDGPLGNGIGLDRQDITVGYFLDNVVPSCGPCNIQRHRTEGGRKPGGGRPRPLGGEGVSPQRPPADDDLPAGERITPGTLGYA